jgi:hypothetical protein
MNEGLQVIMASAFYRDGEPGGIAVGMKFDSSCNGVAFCEQLEACLPEYDNIGLHLVERQIRHLAPRREGQLDAAEVMHVIACVHWLQTRGHLASDEYNGTIFACVYRGALVNCECNPVTLNLDSELAGKNAVDVTSIVKASHLVLDAGATDAIRTVVDHARRQR